MKILTIILFSSLFISNYCQANQQEIDSLLSFIKNTSCQYERNGTRYNGVEAAKHVRKKYNYYLDDIKTTEDFIRLSATKSMMSGKKYNIYCADKPTITSQQWLLSELTRIREANSLNNPK